MKYFAVAYAHVIRWAKASSANEACKQAYGLVDTNRMTVVQTTNPRYMRQKDKKEVLDALTERHFEKTGSVIK